MRRGPPEFGPRRQPGAEAPADIMFSLRSYEGGTTWPKAQVPGDRQRPIPTIAIGRVAARARGAGRWRQRSSPRGRRCERVAADNHPRRPRASSRLLLLRTREPPVHGGPHRGRRPGSPYFWTVLDGPMRRRQARDRGLGELRHRMANGYPRARRAAVRSTLSGGHT